LTTARIALCVCRPSSCSVVLFTHCYCYFVFFFFSSRRRHTRLVSDWSSDVCSSDLNAELKSKPSQSHIDPGAPDFLSSHPATPERISNAQASARQFNAPGAGERDKAAYLASIDGMVYGEDPSEGFVRGRRFLHPRLGFTFLAPDGFVLDNTAQAVLGVKDGGGQALRLDVVRVPAEQTLADYLNSGWVENIDPKSVEEIVINGLPAATAMAKGD